MFCSKHWEICLDGDRVIRKHTNMYQVIYQNGPGNRRSMIVDRERKVRQHKFVQLNIPTQAYFCARVRILAYKGFCLLLFFWNLQNIVLASGSELLWNEHSCHNSF